MKMPYKDPKGQKKWRQRNHTPAYNRWLYARRKVRFDNLQTLEEAIIEALRADSTQIMKETLTKAIEKAHHQEHKVGNRFDHQKDKPYYQKIEST